VAIINPKAKNVESGCTIGRPPSFRCHLRKSSGSWLAADAIDTLWVTSNFGWRNSADRLA
jgi:hypothetical protein